MQLFGQKRQSKRYLKPSPNITRIIKSQRQIQKYFSKILRRRLQQQIEQKRDEKFRSGKWTADSNHVLIGGRKRTRGYNLSLHLLLVHCKKPFHFVEYSAIWESPKSGAVHPLRSPSAKMFRRWYLSFIMPVKFVEREMQTSTEKVSEIQSSCFLDLHYHRGLDIP